MTDSSFKTLLSRGIQEFTWRARIKLYVQACLPPWPLSPWSLNDPQEGVYMAGYVHEDGRIFITRIWHYGKEL